METLNFVLFFFILSRRVYCKSTSHSSQDILQSNGTTKPETRTQEEVTPKERCDLEPDDSVSEEFKGYVDKFNESESGKFLKDLINNNETVSKISKPITNLLEKVDKQHIENLNQVHKEPFNQTWNVVSLGLAVFYAVLLGYLVIAFPLSSYTVITITSYVFGTVIMGMSHDLLPLWVVASMGLGGGLAIWLVLSFVDSVKRRLMCVLSILLVFSKVVYDLHAMIPYESVSPNFSGVAGILVNLVLRQYNFMAVRLVYLVFLLLLSASFYLKLPSFVAGEPMELEEIDVGATIMKRLLSFVCALPAAGFCIQVYSGFRRVANPLGPMTYFVVPTKFRVNELGSYLAIVLWVSFSILYYELIKHSPENHLLTPPKKRRSWREYTRTISRL